MTGIIFALLSAFFIAVFQVLLRKSNEELKPSISFFFDAVFGLLIWVPLALFMGVNFGLGLQEALMYAVISAILSEAFVFFALSHGELAVTATIVASYPVYTVILSRFINNEVLSPVMLFFVVCAIVGSIWAVSPNRFKPKEMRLRKEIVWPFLAAVAIGFSDTISKGYIDRSGDFSLLFMLGFVQIPVALAYLRLEKHTVKEAIAGTINKLSHYRYALLGGLFNIIGTGFLWLSFSYAPASIASPITGANGALTVILANYILREKLSLQKYLASH